MSGVRAFADGVVGLARRLTGGARGAADAQAAQTSLAQQPPAATAAASALKRRATLTPLAAEQDRLARQQGLGEGAPLLSPRLQRSDSLGSPRTQPTVATRLGASRRRNDRAAPHELLSNAPPPPQPPPQQPPADQRTAHELQAALAAAEAEAARWKAAAQHNAAALAEAQRNPLQSAAAIDAVVAALSARCGEELREQLRDWTASGASRRLTTGAVADFEPGAWLAAVKAGGRVSTLLLVLEKLYDAVVAPGGDAAEQQRAHNLSLALTLSSLCKAGDAQFHSALGWQAALVIKAVTGSALALDMLNELVAGAPSNRQLSAWKEKLVEVMKQSGGQLAGNTDLIMALDGVGARHQHRCRVALAQSGSGVLPAVTSFLALHSIPSTPSPQLQRSLEHSPSQYAARATLPPDFLQPRSTPVDGEERSETGVLEVEARAQRASALAHVLGTCKRRADGTWHDPLVEQVGATAAGPPLPADLPKICDACGHAHGPRAHTCDLCPGKVKLPTMEEMRRRAETAAQADGRSIEVVVKTRRVRHMDVSRCTFVDGKLKIKREYQEHLSADSPAAVGDRRVTLVHEVLLTLPYEPNTAANIEAVYQHIGVICRVRGFVPDDQVEREWVAIVSDQGALCRDVLDRKDSKFLRLLHIPGTGHECTVYLRSVHALLNSFGMDGVIQEVYAATPGTVAYLTRGADVHQVRDWVLSVVSPALWQAAAREYVQSGPGDKTADGFDVWLRSTRTDPRGAFVADVLQHLLPGLRCVHIGIRSGYHINFSAGRMEMLPWMLMRNGINYVPLVIRDRADGEFLNTPEVRAWRHRTLSCANGEGADYVLEEVHAHYQAANPGSGRYDWEFASGFHDLNREARAQLLANLGVAERYIVGSRPPLDLSADRAAVERRLWRFRSLQPDTSPAAVFRDLTGAPLVSGAFDMRSRGVEEAKLAAAAFIKGEHYVVRKAQPLKAKEVVEEPVAVHSALTQAKDDLARQAAELKAAEARVAALVAAAPPPGEADASGPAGVGIHLIVCLCVRLSAVCVVPRPPFLGIARAAIARGAQLIRRALKRLRLLSGVRYAQARSRSRVFRRRRPKHLAHERLELGIVAGGEVEAAGGEQPRGRHVAREGGAAGERLESHCGSRRRARVLPCGCGGGCRRAVAVARCGGSSSGRAEDAFAQHCGLQHRGVRLPQHRLRRMLGGSLRVSAPLRRFVASFATAAGRGARRQLRARQGRRRNRARKHRAARIPLSRPRPGSMRGRQAPKQPLGIHGNVLRSGGRHESARL